VKRRYNEIARALALAATAHEKQRRKGNGTPYFVHPAEVAMLLIEEDAPQEVVVAGILHDLLEDTKVTPEEIREGFGGRVLELVTEVSEVINPVEKECWEARKERSIAKLPQMSQGALLITCADKLSNLRSIYQDEKLEGSRVWEKFNRGQSQQLWYYRSILEGLKPLEGTGLYGELKRYMDLVFGEHRDDR